MGLQNQSTERCIQEVKYQSLWDDSQGKQRFKPMARKTA